MPGMCTDAQKQQLQNLLNQLMVAATEAIDSGVQFWDLLVNEALPQLPPDHPAYPDAQLLIQDWPGLRELLTRQINSNDDYKQLIMDMKNYFSTALIFSRTGSNNPSGYDQIYQVWLSYENGDFDRNYTDEECQKHINKISEAIQSANESNSLYQSGYNTLNQVLNSGNQSNLYEMIMCILFNCLSDPFHLILDLLLIYRWAVARTIIASGAAVAGATVSTIITTALLAFTLAWIIYCIINKCKVDSQ